MTRIEFEVKVLEPNFDIVKERLQSLGGEEVTGRRLMRRIIFDYPDKRLHKAKSYLRVRDEGGVVTTTFKSDVNKGGVDDVSETQVEVSDFTEMCELYKVIGFEQQTYQETYRTSWRLGEVEIEFDEWPWIDKFFEIEASSEEEVAQTLQKLGYTMEQTVVGDVTQLYTAAYDITPAKLATLPKLIFEVKPIELKAKSQ